MWFLNILILSVPFVAQGKSVIKNEPENCELKWPDQYSFEATRVYLLAGFTEEYQMWRTANKSRIDYNGGAVKSVVWKKKRGIKYEIHPESDKNQEAKLVCKKTKGSIFERFELEDILPDTSYDFEAVDVEELNDVENTKFYYKEKSSNVETEYTIWAVYKDGVKAWLPTRFEDKETNTWLGILDKHEIWEFNNVNTEFEDTYFDVEEYCKDAETYRVDQKEVTENLLFLNPENNHHVEHAFGAFKKKHSKIYFQGEHEMRKTIFRKNMRLISSINRKNLGYKLAVNQFADRTEAELKKSRGLLSRPKGVVGTVPFPYSTTELDDIAETLPKEYDTRLYGLVSPVRNQETCGSCWTFGTTASMEGALARRTGNLITLSNQALLDCAWAYGAAGCDGGFDIAAYQWMTNYGLPTEAEYGVYTNSDGYCRINNMTKTYPISGYTDVSPYSVNALKVALINHGPLSVSVNANPDSFSYYSTGIYYDPDCSPTILTHEVALVGYGEENGDTYWILKNSWGKEWGLDGYMHISAKDNNCGVATEPTYVVM